jgi:hypothetical protein
MAYFLLHSGQPSAKRLLKRIPSLTGLRSGQTLSDSDVVIRWGASSRDEPPVRRVLNTKDAVLRTTSRPSMAKILKRVGIRVAQRDTSSREVNYIRTYQIALFDLYPIACFRSDTSGVWLSQRIQRVQENFREVPLDDDKLTTRVVHYAVRSLHALGLDHGLVSIAVGPKGVLYVQDVTATPVLDGALLTAYAGAIEKMMEEKAPEPTDRVLIGTDIEMMLENTNGKMVLASAYLPRKGRVGCDDRSIQFDGKRRPLVELRPDADESPVGLINNLKATMFEATRLIPRPSVKWKAGSMPFRPYSTGGHIHFSGVRFTSRFVKVLDNYLGLPLMLVEHRETAQLRRPKYGFLGDVRHKDHGGFEYRTPASFIVDPVATAAAFCIAYLLAIHHDALETTDIYEPAIQYAFYRGDTELIRPIALQNLNRLREVALYERYQNYIEPFIDMVSTGQTWDEQVDVRTVWGIPIEEPVRSKTKVRRKKRVLVRHTG